MRFRDLLKVTIFNFLYSEFKLKLNSNNSLKKQDLLKEILEA